ncbi:MAG TPA: cell division protein FtsK, partial [Clostridium sp.]|nr:cell division protein FtsK [Clostridium sp.]
MTKGKEPLKKKNSSKKSTVKNNSSKAKRAKKDKLFDFNGIILITIGVLIFLALLSVMFSDPTSLAGSMGVFINRIFIGLLGIGAYVLPFVLIYMGVSYIKIDKYLRVTKKSLGILIFIVTTMIFVELIVLPAYYVKGNMASAIIDQFKSKSVLHGGIISLIITVPISSLLGKVGSYIVLFALYIKIGRAVQQECR